MSADARAKALSALARFHVTRDDCRRHLRRAAGITMLGADGHPTTAVYTDPLSPEITRRSTARESAMASTPGGISDRPQAGTRRGNRRS